MAVDNWNEADVREEIANPLLRQLGYKKGTAYDILREEQLSLRYGRIFLGRKKGDRDVIIRGKPDYVLNVLGNKRWIFEIKAPNEEFDVDSIEQAISYARHPEVSAYYIALLNGREFRLYNFLSRASEPPLIEPIYDRDGLDPKVLAESLTNILSPAAIIRDLSLPEVDKGMALGPGLRSVEKIRGGEISYTAGNWKLLRCPAFAEKPVSDQLNENFKIFDGMQTTIVDGSVFRDMNGRIIANLKWATPHKHLEAFAEDKGLFNVDYVSLSQTISDDENNPTTFDVVGKLSIIEGETVFDIKHWQSVNVDQPLDMSFRGQSVGYLDEKTYLGIFQSEYFVLSRATDLEFEFVFQLAGTLSVELG